MGSQHISLSYASASFQGGSRDKGGQLCYDKGDGCCLGRTLGIGWNPRTPEFSEGGLEGRNRDRVKQLQEELLEEGRRKAEALEELRRGEPAIANPPPPERNGEERRHKDRDAERSRYGDVPHHSDGRRDRDRDRDRHGHRDRDRDADRRDDDRVSGSQHPCRVGPKHEGFVWSTMPFGTW